MYDVADYTYMIWQEKWHPEKFMLAFYLELNPTAGHEHKLAQLT